MFCTCKFQQVVLKTALAAAAADAPSLYSHVILCNALACLAPLFEPRPLGLPVPCRPASSPQEGDAFLIVFHDAMNAVCFCLQVGAGCQGFQSLCWGRAFGWGSKG